MSRNTKISTAIEKAFDKILPIPRQPRVYRRPPPHRPLSWIPHGSIGNLNYEERLESFANELLHINSQKTSKIKYGSRGWCLPPEMLAWTNRGLVSVKDVNSKTPILSFKEQTFEVGWKKVLETHQRNFSGELVKIKAYNLLPLLVTPEHDIAVTTVQTFQNGGKKRRQIGNVKWVRAKDLVIKPSAFRRSRNALCYLINREVVDQPKWDEELCRLMGYYLAEGSPFRSNRPNKTVKGIEFSLNIREKQFADDIKNLAKKHFNANTSFIDRKEQGTKRVLVYSAKMARFLTEHCGEGASKKQLSQTVMRIAPEKQFEIFLGFVRGDGRREENTTLAWTTSKKLALQLQQICFRNNKIATCWVRTDNGKGDNLPLYTVQQITSKRHIGIIKGDLFFAPIRKIKREAYSGKVYNLEVTDNENYCADGILVHNCYLLEGLGKIHKGEFTAAQKAINDCRKLGFLPIDFVAQDQDQTRHFKGIHVASAPETQLQQLQQDVEDMLRDLPSKTTDYWIGEEYYVMLCVEKGDLINLFKPVCDQYHVPIVSSKGWPPILLRSHIAKLSQKAEAQGLKPVLLLFYDHDPAGLKISSRFRKNLRDCERGTRWSPEGLIIDRFGLNKEDIEKYGLMWIENLRTSSGRRSRDYQYINIYGYKKCESNALFKNDETLKVGEEVCRRAIEKYYGADALERFGRKDEASKEKLYDVYDDSVWKSVEESLDELIEQLGSVEEKEEPGEVKLEEETVVVVDNKHYGLCPRCQTQFNYSSEDYGKQVRCRGCRLLMRLQFKETES